MFKNLNLGKRIAVGFFSIIFLMVLLVAVVCVSLLSVVINSDIVAKEYNPEVFILGELYDDLSSFIAYGNYFFLSGGDGEFYDNAVEMSASFSDHIQGIRDLSVTAPNILMRNSVEKFSVRLDDAKKSLLLLSQRMEEKTRLENQVFAENGDNAVELAKKLKESFHTDTRQWVAAANLKNAILLKKLTEDMATYEAQARESLRILNNSEISSSARQNVQGITTHLDLFVSGMNSLVAARDNLQAAHKEFEKAEQVLYDLNEYYYASSIAGGQNAKYVSGSLRATITILLVGLLVCIILAIISVKLVMKATVGTIKQAISGLSNVSDRLAMTSGEIFQGAQGMADGASASASNLEEISTSLKEITSMTKQTADNARSAETIVVDSVKKAKDSQDAMHRLQEAVVEIQKSSNDTAKILKDIDDIAFQTNLLALNAAVEAARAGEAGKGFAVVAEEVRNLAQRSAESAKKTAALIEGSQTSSSRGVNLAGETAQTIEKITEASNKIAVIVSEITSAANEQAKGVSQVNASVINMDQVTQSNASASKELATSSDELSSQATSMNGLVGELIKIVDGEAAYLKALDEFNAKMNSSGMTNSRRRSPKTASKIIYKPTTTPKTETLIPFDDDNSGGY
jgi:methyl-accepting chemotaxis protein